MTSYHTLLDLFWHGSISLDEWAERANLLYPVPATPPKTVLRPLHEVAPTWCALVATEAKTNSALRSAA